MIVLVININYNPKISLLKIYLADKSNSNLEKELNRIFEISTWFPKDDNIFLCTYNVLDYNFQFFKLKKNI